jgi:hypothetical protein
MDNSTIVIRGAREHNLRNVHLELPRNRLIVFTGVSGSGKSSLAFDTLYAEGQRRYVESLSSYARQSLGRLQKPDVVGSPQRRFRGVPKKSRRCGLAGGILSGRLVSGAWQLLSHAPLAAHPHPT